MNRRSDFARRAAVLALAATLAAPGLAAAAQIRVNLSGTSFNPATVSVHQGDHVVWVWGGGTHSVTSGTDGSTTGDGVFNAGIQSTGATGNHTAFTWRVDRTGNVPYYCSPHFDLGMTGIISVQPPSTSLMLGDFRITEVLYASGAGNDLVEIANLGTAPGDLGRYRFVVSGVAVDLPLDGVTIVAGGRVVIHPGVSGTNSATDLFVPAMAALPDAAGSLALYAPNTIPGQTSLDDATQIVDYVAWGAAGQPNEATAVAAGLWTAGEFVPTVGAPGHSIEFCSGATDHGAGHWAEISPPNFGGNGDCLTPTRASTWGRLKRLYR